MYRISIDRRTTCLLFALFLSSIVVKSQPDYTLRIDPTYARGGKASQFFDEISFIPLETTKESSFGILQNIQVSANYIAFADVITKAIFIFKKDGSFHSKITELPSLSKTAPGFFRALSGFHFKEGSEIIHVVYAGNDKLRTRHLAVFSPDGKLLESKELQPSFNDMGGDFSFLNGNKTLFASEGKDSSTTDYFSIVDKMDKVTLKLLPRKTSDPFSKSWNNKYTLRSQSAEGSIWSRSYDKTFFLFDKKGKPSSYSILLPASLCLDPEFYENASVIGNQKNCFEYLSAHRDKISEIGDVYKIKNMITFSVTKYNTSGPMDAFWYNTVTQNLYCAGRVSPDSLCYSLPVFALPSIVGTDENYIYLNVPAFILFNAAANLPNKPWQSNLVLNTYFTTQNNKSNPVLVRLKFKKNL